MGKTLGIFVSTDDQLDKLINLCKAARKKRVEVKIFLSHIGTLLTRDPEFKNLTDLAEISLCKVGFEANKLETPVPGLQDKAYRSQSQHAEMIHDCDQYLSF